MQLFPLETVFEFAILLLNIVMKTFSSNRTLFQEYWSTDLHLLHFLPDVKIITSLGTLLNSMSFKF